MSAPRQRKGAILRERTQQAPAAAMLATGQQKTTGSHDGGVVDVSSASAESTDCDPTSSAPDTDQGHGEDPPLLCR